jgi:hypothetical protein
MATKSKEQRIHAALLKHVTVPRIDDPDFLTRDLRGLINKMMIPQLEQKKDGSYGLAGRRHPVLAPCWAYKRYELHTSANMYLLSWSIPSSETMLFYQWSPRRKMVASSDGYIRVQHTLDAFDSIYRWQKNSTHLKDGTHTVCREYDAACVQFTVPRITEFGELDGPLPTEAELLACAEHFLALWSIAF